MEALVIIVVIPDDGKGDRLVESSGGKVLVGGVECAKIHQEPSNSTGAKANRLNRKITCRPEADAGRKGSPR